MRRMRSGMTMIGLILILAFIFIIIMVTISVIAKIAWLILTSKAVLVILAICGGYYLLKKMFGNG